MPSKDKVRELALLPLVKELQSHLRAMYSSLRGRCECDWNQTLWEFGPRNEAYGVPGCASSPTCSRRLGWRCFVIRASLILWGAHSDLRAECAAAVYHCGLEANKTWSGKPWMWLCSDVFWVTNTVRRWEGGRQGQGTSGLSLRGQIAYNSSIRFGHLHLLTVALVVGDLLLHFVKDCIGGEPSGVGRLDFFILIWKNVMQEPLCKMLKQDTFSGLVCNGDSFRTLLSGLNF